MSEIGELIQAYQDKHGTSDRALALRVGVTATLIGKWKRGRFAEVPAVERVQALADQMGTDQQAVLSAFLRDLGYLPLESDGDDRTAAPMNKAARMTGRQTQAERDKAAEVARDLVTPPGSEGQPSKEREA